MIMAFRLHAHWSEMLSTVLLSVNICKERDELLKDLAHEVRHIINNDFYNGLPIQKVEAS